MGMAPSSDSLESGYGDSWEESKIKKRTALRDHTSFRFLAGSPQSGPSLHLQRKYFANPKTKQKAGSLEFGVMVTHDT
jgi:hypothetical protein